MGPPELCSVLKKTGTVDEHALDVKYDGKRPTKTGSSRHAPTSRNDEPRSTHSDLLNGTMEEDDAILGKELFLMKVKGATDADLKSSAVMYSGDFCHICFRWRQTLTSSCHYLQRKSRFF